MALWVLHAHAFDAAWASPRLALISPVPECGKTTTLSLLGRLVPRSMLTSNVSPAVVYRAIERDRPTLLMDEADTYMEQREDLRGILNSGHTPDTAFVWRCAGNNFEPHCFTTWSPMAIAKIGKLPATLASRSIIIPMRRKRPDEKVERFSADRDAQRLEELARKGARFAQDNMEKLKGDDPEMPEGMSNRVADNWRPLLAIADAAGGDWPRRARCAAPMFSGGEAETSQGEQMLADIHEICVRLNLEQIGSQVLCVELGKLEDRPLGSFDNGNFISPQQLATLLRPFGIKPGGIRVGSTTPKGYKLAQFQDAFARYLPEKRNTATSEEDQGIGPSLSRNTVA